MKTYELKDKIVEVWAAAKVVVRKYGRTRKFAKHIAAFAIRQHENFNDVKPAEFLAKDPIGELLGYKKRPHVSTFSKVRKRADPQIFEDVYNTIVEEKFRGKQLRLIVQDSTDVFAYSKKDKEAKWGHRTPSKKEQLMRNSSKEKELFYGYKPHVIAEAETGIPLKVKVPPANTNDRKPFPDMFAYVRETFSLQYMSKFAADAQYSSWKIREIIRDGNMIPLVPYSGNQYRKTQTPKDPDYGRRWSVEHVFSRLKGMFALGENRFIGIKKVTIHVFSCLLANLIRYIL